MVRSSGWLRLTVSLAALAGAVGLQGCQAVREASGSVKTPLDEFTVLTKAPLVIPPDFNLRPPQPGIASRNEILPDEQAQTALFAVSPEDQLADLGTDYSDGERLLLSRSQALAADPAIRRTVNADAGEEDFGPDFASKLLYEGAKPPPPRVGPQQQPAGQFVAATQPVETQGFFGRNFGFLGLGGGATTAAQVQQQAVIVPQQPQPQVVAQAQVPQQPLLQPVAVQTQQQVAQLVQPTRVQAPQAVLIPQQAAVAQQPVYAQPPQMAAAPIPQSSMPVEQPGWFTRNFIMSPQQRAALAAGQPVPPSVTQQIEQQQQQQALQQQFYTAAPAPTPQVAAGPGQFVAPQVVVAQPMMPQAAMMAPAQRAPARNLYQYLFTGAPQQPQATPVSVAVQPQQQIIMVPVPAAPQVQAPRPPQAVPVPQAGMPQTVQPAPAPVIVQPVPAAVIVQQPQAQQQEKSGGLFGWLPF